MNFIIKTGGVFVFALFISHTVAAQTPTDNELYAGYCLGAMKENVDGITATPQTQVMAQGRQSLIAYFTDKQRRFASYLLALNGPSDGVLIAAARGRGDAAACNTQIRQCLSTPGAIQHEPCYATHYLQLKPCSTANRCLMPDSLPF
jgi:hypothetical protein